MISLLHWHTEPFLVGGILLIGWLYSIAVGPLRARWFGPSPLTGALSVPPFPKREAIYFYSGLLSLYLAVGSPLDALGEGFLFSAHMLQHVILMYGTALLLIIGVPGWMYDSLFLRWSWLRIIVRFLGYPLVAGVFFTIVFSGWHVPVLYDSALHNKPLHTLEHLTMIGVSMMMWWPIATPSRVAPASSVWTQCLFVFALMIAQTPIFAILVFSEHVLYPTYEYAPRVINLDPLEDQILGGVVMKVFNVGISLMIMARAFVTWGYRQHAIDQGAGASAKAGA